MKQLPVISFSYIRAFVKPLWRYRVLGLVSAILLVACSSGPPPKLYLLESQSSLDPTAKSIVESTGIASLGISKVIVPGYAGDARIASLSDDGSVYLSDDHRWAEEPEDAITRLLANRLRFHAKANVLIEPWPRDYKPDARVEVVFDRLLREPLGGAEMSGQIQLVSSDGRKLIDSVPFRFVRYGRDTNRAVFFTAVSEGINDIARLAIEQLIKKSPYS